KVVQVELSAAEREMAAGNWRKTMPPAEEDDRAVAARFSLPWPGDPLLNDAAKIGIHLSFFSARHCVYENRVGIFSFRANRSNHRVLKSLWRPDRRSTHLHPIVPGTMLRKPASLTLLCPILCPQV